jgi:hypothetical protein
VKDENLHSNPLALLAIVFLGSIANQARDIEWFEPTPQRLRRALLSVILSAFLFFKRIKISISTAIKSYICADSCQLFTKRPEF